jgi:DNA-binding MarR family transcriptional regulator
MHRLAKMKERKKCLRFKAGRECRLTSWPLLLAGRNAHYARRPESGSTEPGVAAQWAFLRILWNEDGLNQKDVASRVGVHQTTAVRAIRILERNGYVRRERSSEDKRNVFVYLTDAGKLLAHELIPFASKINQKSLTGISPEEAEHLMALLLKIQRNLQAVSWDLGCMAV